jgi:hypothetical protein
VKIAVIKPIPNVIVSLEMWSLTIPIAKRPEIIERPRKKKIIPQFFMI